MTDSKPPEKTSSDKTSTEKKVQFSELGLSKVMLASLKAAGYEWPTPIQASLIPLAMDDLDVLGQARTGTGKTAAFVIPILEALEPAKNIRGVQALILVPTRELAVQVRDEVKRLGKDQRFQSVAIYGGKPIRGQIEKLRRGAAVVIGTPGRVLDHIGRGTLDLKDVWCVVLDEADRMLDIGFRPDIEKILRKCPDDRQTLLLSATVPPPIQRLARRYMHEPETIDCSAQDLAVETIEQFYFTVDQSRKYELLKRLLEREKPSQGIVFCRTKRGTERLYQRLSKRIDGVNCIHGDLQQSARDRVMKKFRSGQLTLLIATDVVGRGIDVSSISHIVNYDTPQFCDDYVHRVGRTGRMGREGVAYTFVTPEEGSELTRIEQRINRELKRADMPGFELVGPTMRETDGGGTEPEAEKRAPPSSLQRRPPRRHRRAL